MIKSPQVNNLPPPLSLSLSHTHTHTKNRREDPTGRTAATFTDSKVTIDALKNYATHCFLIEEIRNKV